MAGTDGMTRGGLTRDELKRAVCEAIDRQGNAIIELGERILHHPETGFNETRTAALVARDDGASWASRPQTGLGLTGVKGRLRGGAPGPAPRAARRTRQPAHLRAPARRPAYRRGA